MKRIKKLSLVILLLAASLCVIFSGCNTEIPYNAVIYDRAITYLKDDYREANMTGFWGNGEGPDDIRQVIKTQQEFEEAFESFPEELDFETQMLVLYFFTDIYDGFGCSIKDVNFNEETLNIKILHHQAEPDKDGLVPPCTSAPTHRCLLIKMDKLDFQELEVKIVY